MDEKLKQYRNLGLPESFWVDLLQVRNYLMGNKKFFDNVYSIENANHPFSQAFRHIDCWLDKVVQEWDEEDRTILDS